MYEFRITKYDPKLRDTSGAFTQDQWTSHSDVGATFLGVALTEQEYERVESAYITAATSLLYDCGITELVVSGVAMKDEIPNPLDNGQIVQLNTVSKYFQGVLREEYWCRFESSNGAFVHFGYDYYMYVGLPISPANSIQSVKDLGLFVEPFISPYHELEQDV